MSKQRRFRAKREGLNVHHIRPSSRGGGSKNNLVLLPVEFHAAFHKVAGNLTLEETFIFLSEVMKPGYEWSYKDLDALRRRIMER